MSAVFLGFFNRAVAAGWLVLAVLALRLLLRRAPKRLTSALWAVVAVRLALPFSIPSPLSLIPSAQTVVPESIHAARPVIETGIPAVNAPVSDYLQSVYYEGVTVPVGTAERTADVLAVIWIAGAALLALYCLVTWLRLRLRLRTAVRLRDDLWQSEWVDSPFVLGLLRPRIYLPFRLSDDDLAAVEAHERAHIARGDHLWRLLAFALLALYWFHPLLWIAYLLFCRDLEYACDERAIRSLDGPGRQRYSAALLRCAAPRRTAAPCPVAFGEAGVGGRIKYVLNYRKPAFWIVLTAVIALIAAAVCFLTDPPVKNAKEWLRTVSAARLRDAELCLNYDGSGQGPYYNSSSFTANQRRTLATLLRQVDPSHVDEIGHQALPPEGCSLYFPKHGVYLSPAPYDSTREMVALRYQEQLFLIRDRELADFLRGVLPGETLAWYQRLLERDDAGSDYLLIDLRFACDIVDITYSSGLLDRGKFPTTVLNPDGASSGQSGSATVLGGSRITWTPPAWDGETSLYPGELSPALSRRTAANANRVHGDFTLTLSGGENDRGQLTIDVYGTPDYQGSRLVGVTYRFTVLNNTLPVMATVDGNMLRLWDGVCDAPEYPENRRDDRGFYFFDNLGASYWDIDGDGVKEACSLGFGPTSGLFTYAVAAWTDGQLKYADVFLRPDHVGQISFVRGQSGLQIAITDYNADSPAGGAGETHLYDVSVRDGHIVLTGEEGELRSLG